ncbi:hypothetical protein SBOR_7579 [Sclerotinia borealis F-4128]|uniref:Uncharacterized protein n=1 Tax=Sclerotinia borealis (strain F-4128) TaxID=1432307 RepID=W9C5J8_SCLBF|nr:hypothetical protein SBOR_7579 [Sclerotinia borealis F-4128]
MARRNSYFFNPAAPRFTPNSSPITPSLPNFASWNGTHPHNTQYSQGSPVPPPHEFGQIANHPHFPTHNGTHAHNMPYTQDSSFPPSHGYGHGQIASHPHVSTHNGTHFYDLPYYQGATVPPSNGFAQMTNPLYFPLNNGTHTSNVPYYQGAAGPQFNGFGQTDNPLRHFDPAPQGNNNSTPYQSTPAPQRYTQYNSGFNPIAPLAINLHRVSQYNSPQGSVAPATSAPYGGNLTGPLNEQYPLATPGNNRMGQMITSPPVQQTPDSTAFSPRVPHPTPASTSGSKDSAITNRNDVVIKRKPKMKPKKDLLSAEDMIPGATVWLSEYEDWHEPIKCVKNHECNDPEKDREGRNHPVAILQIHQRHGSDIIGDIVLDVAIMTTLNGLTLRQYMKKMRNLGPDPSSNWYFQYTMPLSWTPNIFGGEANRAKLEKVANVERRTEIEEREKLDRDGNNLLFLSRGTMQRRTYVRVYHIYAVPLKQLQACNRYAPKAHMIRLDEKSYRTVMERLGLRPDPWEDDVNRSVAMAPQRLRDLRDAEMARVNAMRSADDESRRDEAATQQRLNADQQHSLSDVAAGKAKGDEY